jgi:hypothetical protein
MKKVLMAAMTLVMAVFASCTNEDLTVENNDVKVNFTVAEKASFDVDARALKNGWANDDEIVIVFQGKDGWLNCADGDNSLKLKKTETGWTVDDSKIPAIENLSSGKSFFAIHHPGEMTLGNQSNTLAYIDSYTSGNEYLYYQGTYTISGSEISLGQIVMKRPSSSFQISVNIESDYTGDWTMKLHNSSGFAIDQCYRSLYMMLMATVQVSGTSTEEAKAVTIGTDKVFTFRGGNSSTAAQWISVTKPNGTFYYKLSETKTMSDLANKAWTLPKLTINDSDEIEDSEGWSESMD